MRLAGTLASLKSTTTWSPIWCRLTCICGSESLTITRPAPSVLRRKSMARSSRTPPPPPAATAPEEAAPALARAALPPSMTMMLLPSTRVSYGTSLSRFSTRRVRPLFSAASMVSRPEACTSMRREASARVVVGRSKEVRAGVCAMHQAVLRLHQAVHQPAEAQRADHLQRVERELLEELAVALGVGTYAAIARTGTRGARQERRAQLGRRVQEGLVGLDLRQRLDAPARLLLRVLDEARQLVVRARARRERGVADARQGHAQQV